MEKLTALYYPTILIPRGSWLNYTLLYWEQLASIKPQSWIDNVENVYLDKQDDHSIYSDPSGNFPIEKNWVNTWDHPDWFLSIRECKDLEDAGYLRTIKPEKLVHDFDKWKKFEHEFKSIINSRRNLPKCGQNRLSIDETWIQTDKISQDLGQFLILKKLVCKEIQQKDNLDYYLFERETGEIYMTLLARYLADSDSKTTIPLTIFDESWEINYKPIDNKQKFVCVNVMMNLPVPTETVSLEKILDFRKKNHPDFEKLQESIANLELRVKKMDNESDVEDECKKYIRNITIDVENIKQKFQDEQIKTISAAIRASLSKEELTKAAGSGLIVNKIFSMATGLPITPLTYAVASAAGIIEQSSLRIFDGWINNKTKENADLREFPFSYFYKAESSGIISLRPKRRKFQLMRTAY
jgi:hypothetical protein